MNDFESPDDRPIDSFSQSRTEELIEASIRPQNLGEYLGQHAVKEQMEQNRWSCLSKRPDGVANRWITC